MKDNFVIIHTGAGRQYASVIARSLMWISNKKRKPITTHVVSVNDVAAFFEQHTELTKHNTIIHPRAAHPSETGWMGVLFALQEAGFTIINSPQALRLTSDKLAGAIKMQGVIAHPKTWKVDADGLVPPVNGGFVLKPQTSMEQGARVVKISYDGNTWRTADGPTTIKEQLRIMGTTSAVLQELVEYSALYRVIVLNGTALPYSFMDKPEFHPTNWKVSVCLNKTSMVFVPNPDPALLHLAEQAQACVGAKISFVDIFRTIYGGYTMSEINTACNLTIHEGLAKTALGETGAWNIHYRIAKLLWESAQ